MSWETTKKKLIRNFQEALDSGGVDSPIVPYLERINAKKNYATSSSCYGRIMLIDLPDFTKKNAEFLAKWHRTVGFGEVWEAIENAEGENVWFKVDPMILHISCKDIKAANDLLKAKIKAGLKRGGIFSIKRGRVQIELEGTMRMSLPVKKNGGILVNEDYVRNMVKEANDRFRRNEETWGRFMEEFDRKCK